MNKRIIYLFLSFIFLICMAVVPLSQVSANNMDHRGDEYENGKEQHVCMCDPVEIECQPCFN